MRLLNKSRIDSKQIKKLLKFIFRQFPKEAIDLTEIHILDDNSNYPSSITGEAFDSHCIPKQIEILKKGVLCVKRAYKGNKIKSKHSFFVVINIGTKRKYPYTNVYKPRAGKTPVYNDFNEEFVHVLSHELQHVSQFFEGSKTPKCYEVDAERKAHEILKKFREH